MSLSCSNRSQNSEPKARLIADSMRRMLLSGEYSPGDRLPTIRELAGRFGTSVFTVQAAMTPLEEEGLIKRRRRVGTIVNHNPAVLTSAGIYCSGTGMEPQHAAFRNELCRQLLSQLNARKVNMKVFLDPRPQDQQHEPLPPLLQAVERGEIQALVVAGCDHVSLPWLQQLPTTTALVTSCSMPNRVSSDLDHLLRLSLGRLRERGCRTVGLISPIQNSPHLPPDAYEREFYSHFIEALGEAGLKTTNAWMAVPDSYHANAEEYGYRQFKTIWRQTERPDGLLVYPDVAARGVIAAALELGVRGGEDLHMILHRNSGLDLFCPLSVDWVESDVAAWAGALIGLVRRQKSRQPVGPVLLNFRLAENKPNHRK